jgi:hypothetical protein
MATATATLTSINMIDETSFMNKQFDPLLQLLKGEAIDRLDSVIDELPKYKKNLEALIVNFTIDEMLFLINAIFRDNDFKASAYYKRYNTYFDEIEELIHRMQQKIK